MDGRSIARGMRLNRHSLDEDSASRLLQGAVHPDDAPPGYASVADLLAAAASVPALDEDAGAATISAMVEAIRGSAPIPDISRRRSMLGKLFAGKALVAVATLALTAGGAAAATGTLPTPVQGVVADAVSHIGIDLPDDRHSGGSDDPAGHDADEDNDGTTSTTGKAKGHDGDDAGDDSPNKGEVISGITHDPALDGQPKGPTVCAEASDDRCRAGEDHQNSGPGSVNSGEGSNNSGQGSGNSGSGGNADPAGGEDDTVGTSTTSTTVTTANDTTSTTANDHGASGNGGTGASGKDTSGKGNNGKGRSGGSDDS